MADAEDNLESRIRSRAYRIWVDEGRPQGRDQAHWDMASELVAIEDNHRLATTPVRDARPGEPVEHAEAAANTGEFPTTTDQGEQTYPPTRKRSMPG